MKKETAEKLFNDAGKGLIELILSETERSPAWLAGKAGVHQGTIEAVQRGSNTFSRVLLIRLAVAVDVSPVALLARLPVAKAAIKALAKAARQAAS